MYKKTLVQRRSHRFLDGAVNLLGNIWWFSPKKIKSQQSKFENTFCGFKFALDLD